MLSDTLDDESIRSACQFKKLNWNLHYEIIEQVWFAWIWTSDIRGAGTDANVSMQIYGDKGKSQEVKLGNNTDNFEQGTQDKFKVR